MMISPTAISPHRIGKSGINWSSYWKKLFPPTEVNNVLIVGNSYTVGVAADDPAIGGYANLLGEALVALQGSAGKGGYYPILRSGNTYSDNFNHWVFSGTAPVNATSNMCIYATPLRCPAGSISTITATGKNFTLVHYGIRYYNHEISVSVDGGAAQVFTHAAPTDNTNLIYKDELTTDTDGEHTIVITVPASRNFFAGALIAKNGNNGLSYTKLGLSGAGTLTIVPNTLETSFANHISIYEPKLTIIEFGYNDYSSQIALDTYETRITTLVNAALVYGKVAVLNNVDYHPGSVIPIVDYNTRLLNVCTATGAKYVDIHSVSEFDNITDAFNAGLMSNTGYGHPTSLGHQLIYETLFEALKTF